MTEKWKTIDEYPVYEVSNLGRVRSKTRKDSLGRLKKSHVLKPTWDGARNYLQVNLYKNGRGKSVNIHRLVALAFIDNPNGFEEVNHKDENKTNNSADNLEWCTHKYNNNYGSKKASTRGVKNPMCKISLDVAVFIKKNHAACGGTIKNSELSKMFNLSPTHVCAIAHGRRWSYANTD